MAEYIGENLMRVLLWVIFFVTALAVVVFIIRNIVS